MDIIQLLPDNVANQIAAGEVVQRPASVVKELLENSVDAGATSITLILKEAGRSLIQVIDNGLGMSPTDCRLAFERHATSKIRIAEDLFNLHTNGFRGEALASIAAISHVTIKTKQQEQELGTHLVMQGGRVISQEPVHTATGSNIEVKNLFYNIPARRNFLKSNAIETRHIIDAFQRIALTYPKTAFVLIHNDNEIYNLKSANLKQRLVHLFGKGIDEKLVPIQENTDILKVTGFVTKPNFAKRNRGEQFIFVNDRYIKNQYLDHAVHAAYENLITANYHPSYFLYLQVPPNSIDVNIHPTKTEVKFDNEKDLYAILRASVKHSLGQYNASPLLDFNRDPNMDIPYQYRNKEITNPAITVDPDFNPFASNTQPQVKFQGNDTKNWESLYIESKNEKESAAIRNINFEYEQVVSNLFDDKKTPYFSTYQLHNKYILGAIKSGLVVIDQNAAHQRILYEDYLTKITFEGIGSQKLLFPKVIHLLEIEVPFILRDSI
ncbi:MAG: DNA mismatch repair endonuclease MutL [Flavobacteriaceae bacterium]|nr:DNA mismatch repair endonuclease MutL [Flavobacteriaceae bacterium]